MNPELNPYYHQTELVRQVAWTMYDLYPLRTYLKPDQASEIEDKIRNQGLKGLIKVCDRLQGSFTELLRENIENNTPLDPPVQFIVNQYGLLNELSQKFNMNYEFNPDPALLSEAES